MKFLSLEGLTNYTTKLLNKISVMLAEKADKNHTHSYLPLSGGTLSGNVLSTASDTAERHFQVNNSLHNGHLCTSVAGNFGVYSNTHMKWLVKCDTSGNVTLNGSADTVDGFHVGTGTGNYLRPINYGTSALTPGSSSLTTGYVYLQYE